MAADTTDKRNPTACDQCHQHKLKCVASIRGCERCNRLRLRCTFYRQRAKRGRKPKDETPYPLFFDSNTYSYPVLDCLVEVGYFKEPRDGAEHCGRNVLSRKTASLLLDHFYSSPNQEFHTRIIRRCRLLDLRRPRIASPELLLSMLCRLSHNHNYLSDF